MVRDLPTVRGVPLAEGPLGAPELPHDADIGFQLVQVKRAGARWPVLQLLGRLLGPQTNVS
jgi:hypothetical protein